MQKKMMFCLLLMPLLAAAYMSAEESRQDNGDFYPNPGVVTIREGRLVGSDHLYNLSHKIGVFVEIFKAKNVVLPFDEEAIRTRIIEIFKKAHIQPYAESSDDKPALPVFHVLLMIQSLEKGYAVFCEGRLFEDVKLSRVNFAEQTLMQAITWESQNFVIAQPSTLSAQSYASIDKVTNTFIERYKYFEELYRSKKSG